jgi:hypothetical protein
VRDVLVWLEGSPLGHAMRESGAWTYGLVNLAHILGVSSLFGSILVLDLRLLGLWRRVPLASIARPTVTVASTGFVVAAATGLCLITTNATEYAGNPFLLVKFPAIAIGLLNAAVVRTLSGWKAKETRELSSREQPQLAVAGAVSLVSWLTAIAAGRLIGYW